MSTYHLPVMLKESIEGLQIQPEEVIVDATFGGGGHSRVILDHLGPKGKLFGFDQDEDAAKNALDDDRFQLMPHNFRHLKNFLKLYKVKTVDGILADLGVSSWQIDEPSRGFSYRYDSILDMRMNQEGTLTAFDVLNSYDATSLQTMFSLYGEVRNAKTLALTICDGRSKKALKTTNDFLALIDPLIRGNKARYLSQVFQAIRIEVNDEIGALKDFLTNAYEVLRPGGRLVMISYHSLEDRLVKNYLKSGNFDGTLIQDDFGNITRPWKVITKKALLPSDAEIKQNSRARSARFRVGEKK